MPSPRLNHLIPKDVAVVGEDEASAARIMLGDADGESLSGGAGGATGKHMVDALTLDGVVRTGTSHEGQKGKDSNKQPKIVALDS